MNKSTDSVRIVIFDADDAAKFLVLAEADDPENWKLPGGKFDSVDETPQAAAERELREELSLSSSGAGMRLANTLINDDGTSARHIFVAVARAPHINPSAEISGTQWVTEETMPESINKGHILSAVALARETLASR